MLCRMERVTLDRVRLLRLCETRRFNWRDDSILCPTTVCLSRIERQAFRGFKHLLTLRSYVSLDVREETRKYSKVKGIE